MGPGPCLLWANGEDDDSPSRCLFQAGPLLAPFPFSLVSEAPLPLLLLPSPTPPFGLLCSPFLALGIPACPFWLPVLPPLPTSPQTNFTT